MLKVSGIVPKKPVVAAPTDQPLLRRPAIERQLDQAQLGRWLTLVAPTGFGKSSVLQAWRSPQARCDDFRQFSNAASSPIDAWLNGLLGWPPLACERFDAAHNEAIAATCLAWWPGLPLRSPHADERRAVWIFDHLEALGTNPVVWRYLAQVWRILAELGLGGVLVSRCPIDSWLGPLSTSLAQPIVSLDERALRWDAADIAALVQQSSGPAAWSALVLERCEGWPLGVQTVALLPHDAATPSDQIDATLDECLNRAALTEQSFKARRLLMLCALMPQLTAEDALALTHQRYAGELLQNFAETGNFLRATRVDDRNAYRFHPLLRACLLRAARRELDPAVLNRAVLRAAQRLETRDLAAAVALLTQLGHRSTIRKFLLHRVERPSGRWLRELGMQPVNDLLAHLQAEDVAAHGGLALLTSLLSLWRYYAATPPSSPVPEALALSPGHAVALAWDAFALRGDVQGLGDTVLVALHYSVGVAADTWPARRWAVQLRTCLALPGLSAGLRERLLLLGDLYMRPMPLWGRDPTAASEISASSFGSLTAARLIELAGNGHRSVLDRLSATLVLLRDHAGNLPKPAVHDWLRQADRLLMRVPDRSPWLATFTAWVASEWLPQDPLRALRLCLRARRQAHYRLPQANAYLECVAMMAALARGQIRVARQLLESGEQSAGLTPVLSYLKQLLARHIEWVESRANADRSISASMVIATRIDRDEANAGLAWVAADDLARYHAYLHDPSLALGAVSGNDPQRTTPSQSDYPEHWVQFGPHPRPPVRDAVRAGPPVAF